jgi:hypothetical protein
MQGKLLRRVFILICFALAIAASAQTAAQPKKKPSSAKPAASEPAPPALEPKALEILKAAGDKLAAANTMQFTAIELFETLSRQGVPLAWTTKYEVTLQRPDKLRVIMPGDGPASDFYYDGKTMQAYAPAENLLAVADAPLTTDAALEKAYKTAGIYFPFTDFILGNPYENAKAGLRHAYYIGQSKIVGGVVTDMVGFASQGVFAQIWIGADDKLPRMIRAVYVNDPDMLRHEMVFSDWKLDEPIPADTFTPSNVATAKRIPFAHPSPESAVVSDKPPTKPKAKPQ